MSDFRIISTPQDRIKEALSFAHLKPVELAERSGIHKGTISHYLSGQCEPKNSAIYKMAQVLGVDERWLIGYDVPMKPAPATPNATESELLSLYRSLNTDGQSLLMATARTYAGNPAMQKDATDASAM